MLPGVAVSMFYVNLLLVNLQHPVVSADQSIQEKSDPVELWKGIFFFFKVETGKVNTSISDCEE